MHEKTTLNFFCTCVTFDVMPVISSDFLNYIYTYSMDARQIYPHSGCLSLTELLQVFFLISLRIFYRH